MPRLNRRILVFLLSLALVAAVPSPVHAVEYSSEPRRSVEPNGRVYAMAAYGGRVFIGGSFTKVRNPVTGALVARQRLAAFDAETGALDLSWNPGADATVRALAVGPDGVVYAGGAFANAAGRPAVRVVAITPEGGAVPGFTASANAEVRDLVVVGEALFVAGKFGRLNDIARVGVAKVSAATGALVTGWNARVGGGRVLALEVDAARSELLIGGNFTTVKGVSAPFLASVDQVTGAHRAGWIPPSVCGTCQVLDLTIDGDDTYAALAGGGGGRVSGWSLTTGERHWIRLGDGDVQAVDVHGGILYAGGHFAEFAAAPANQLVAIDAATGTVLPYAIPFTGTVTPGVWALRADDTRLVVAGGFQGVEGSTARFYAELPALADPS